MDLSPAIADYLTATDRLPGLERVSFLAAGEYNQNYLVRAAGELYVFRLNRGSQLDLTDQISYEFKVLEAVASSGVTPRPVFVDPLPPGLPGGVLLMAFLPGRPLDYDQDLAKAARVLARVHCLARRAENLIRQQEPVADIAAESWGLIHRFEDHPLTELKKLLIDYHARIMDLHRRSRNLFADEPLVVVNTELNSGNFLIDSPRAGLVDWEKAVLSVRYQDLGHFLVATTTNWKTDTILTEEQKLAFLDDYRHEVEALGHFVHGLERLRKRTLVMEKTIVLRALAWCFMAWYEYTQTSRAIHNPDTLAKIKLYLDRAPELLTR